MFRDKLVGHFVWRFTCYGGGSIIDYLLYLWKDLEPISWVFKGMNKKVKGNLYYLVSFFAEAVNLQIIGCSIKQLNTQLFKECCQKYTKKFQILVGY